jgi:hypothetical protein
MHYTNDEDLYRALEQQVDRYGYYFRGFDFISSTEDAEELLCALEVEGTHTYRLFALVWERAKEMMRDLKDGAWKERSF